MSYQIGLDTLLLRPTPRLAHTEYCSNAALMRHVTGDAAAGRLGRMSPASRGAERFEDLWDFDFLWSTNDGPVPWEKRGRVTDMGHADFLEGGVDRRPPRPCPFTDPDEVWAFDAVAEYGLPDFRELVAYYEHCQRTARENYPHQYVPGGYYKTIVSGAIQSFGWDMLLEAASDPRKFEPVLDSFYRLTLHHVRAQAATGIEVFLQHDDFVWSRGAFMSPDFYRQAIIPRYAELWKVLHQAGKRVLFCSDANWIEFLDDIAGAGADGFIFEPMMPLEPVVERYGKTHVVMGSKVDCRTMTYGSLEEVKRQIDATLELAWECPGFVFAIGNHLPSNVPVEVAVGYMDHLRAHWSRPTHLVHR